MDFSTYKSIVNLNKKVLYETALKAIKNSHLEAHTMALNPQEPDFIAKIATAGIIDLANSWKNILMPYGISTSVVSVFCHQRPIVKHTMSSVNPEIGDLLIVHIYHPKKGKSKRTALLLQAKMMTDHTVKISTHDHQLLLYKHWPQFSFVKPKISGININVVPSQAHNGGQYLLIDDENFMGPFSCTYSTAEADETLIPANSLTHTMLKILLFEEGKEFLGRKAAHNKRDWSKLIWLLLENSVQKNFKRKNIKLSSASRTNGSNLNGLSGLYASLSNKNTPFITDLIGKKITNQSLQIAPENALIPFYKLEGEGGISTIIIESSHINQ
ncbi:hypothetical protein BED47_07685 [Gottfriedia luciferensis]|uniref:Uncharacterized protein n=1 Tax=Gottfriedia luciferensis TaxID=178774 RepID=A0ABX2ZST6_9BACI|nr:hypothetical protein [Gottfriedia luciferensis]ODG91524.1 hypothetical protein BED47_07685 [Gottfriedia luciferensis]